MKNMNHSHMKPDGNIYYVWHPFSPHPPKGFRAGGGIVTSTTDKSIVTSNNLTRPTER